MNNHGQVALVSLMIGVIVVMLGLTFINPIKDVLDVVTGTDQLDCANSTISDGQKMNCLATDLVLPYFIIVVIGVGIAYFTAKWVI